MSITAAKYLARLVLAYALYYTGVLHVLKRRRLRGRAVVLMYHRVLTAAERAHSFSSDAIVVEPDTFARQLAWLRRHFVLLTPEQFAERLREGRAFADASCLVTFDDGWTDNYANALPLLRRFDIPAIIFLPTRFVGAQHGFWQEQLARDLDGLRQAYRRDPAALAEAVATHGLSDVVGGDGDGRRRIHDFVRALKRRPQADVDRLRAAVAAMLKAHGDDTPADHPDRFLDWDQVAAMAAAGIRFGSHAQSHRILPRLDDGEIDAELTESKREIEARLRRPVALFAFPNGDFDARSADAARRAGYAAAFTTQSGTVGANDDPYRVRRINIHEHATRHLPLFYATLLGVL